MKQYFTLLTQYLKSKWTRVVAGVFIGMVAQACALISPLLTRYLIDVVITQKQYALLNNILGMAYRLLGDTENLTSSWSQAIVTLPLQLILLASVLLPAPSFLPLRF